jgi:hypothetical protein
MENHTAKHFVLQLGSLVGLYLSVSFLLVLIFGIVNLKFPDAAEGYWAIESATDGVRIGIAMVVVFFPTYLILTRIVNKLRRSEGGGAYLGLTKWLIYLSLLVGGVAILIDLVMVINTFLEGELTERFLLKALAVLLVVGAAVHYYLLDAKGYWLTQEKRSIYYGSITALIALAVVICGVSYIETPAEVRERKLDEKQITDLQLVQNEIHTFYTLTNTMPSALSELGTAITLPEASAERAPYSYEITDKGFKLCAEFAYPSIPGQYGTSYYYDESMTIKNADNWEHTAGMYCFERVVETKSF